jgi:diguanylate cyclase (GGDEF)-like protein
VTLSLLILAGVDRARAPLRPLPAALRTGWALGSGLTVLVVLQWLQVLALGWAVMLGWLGVRGPRWSLAPALGLGAIQLMLLVHSGDLPLDALPAPLLGIACGLVLWHPALLRRLLTPTLPSDIDAAIARLAGPGEVAHPHQEGDALVQDAVRAVEQSMARSATLLQVALDADALVIAFSDSRLHRTQVRVAAGDTAHHLKAPFDHRQGLAARLRRSPEVLDVPVGELRPPWWPEDHPPGPVLAAGLFDSGIPLGFLAAERVEGSAAFTEHDFEVMRQASPALMAAFHAERALVEVSRSRRELALLRGAVEALQRALTVEEVGDIAWGLLTSMADVDELILTQALADGSHVLLFARGPTCAAWQGRTVQPAERSVVLLAHQRQHVLPYAGRVDDPAELFGDAALATPAASLAVFPLAMARQPIGVAILSSERAGAFPVVIREQLQGIIGYLGAALANALAYHQAVVEATTDGMTGLSNHRTFQLKAREALARAERNGRPVCLVLTDIDHFKQVNDTHGHATGDDVLRAFAQCIRSCLRRADIGARYGGEEFALLLEDTDLDAARALAERVRESAGRLVHPGAGGTPFRVTASFGVAAVPAHATTVLELVESADRALYLAKRSGRNQTRTASELPPQGSQRKLI